MKYTFNANYLRQMQSYSCTLINTRKLSASSFNARANLLYGIPFRISI